MPDIEDLPSWIELPPSSTPAPPITGLIDELPIASLAWADFERLCLRIARNQTDVIGARLYGVPGQNQEGIDLYARFKDAAASAYRVYQCKRVEEFSPVVIRSAVNAFLQGGWASQARSLIVCTTDSVRTTQRAKEIEKQTLRLHKKQIDFIVWAREDISDLLRGEPEIVFEFFGPQWVERFCGKQALEDLRKRRLVLVPAQIRELRNRLSLLYRNIFATHDPGVAVSQQDSPLALYERYVVPDLIVQEEGIGQRAWEGGGLDLYEPNSRIEEMIIQEHAYGYRRRSHSGNAGARRRPRVRGQRSSIEGFFGASTGAKYVILAGPGGGKSAFLRFLALDLLNAQPRLAGVARMWGRFLPVWIPFGAWVEYTEKAGKIVPLSEMLRYWLELFDEGELWPLIESALNDHRLLLLVDGLDEWTSEASARIALTQLNVFAAQRDIPVVLTSRPHGFQQLAAEFPAWKIGEIASLTRPQQTAFAKVWFRKWLAADVNSDSMPTVMDTIEQRAAQTARDFVDDVARLPDLEDLATVPLLFSVMILLHYQRAALPDDRFGAYKALSEQLISIWPRKRRAAALVGSSDPVQLSDAERQQAYACLAFRTLVEDPSGLIAHADARRIFESYLIDEDDGLGFPEQDGKRGARDLVQVGETVSGILVERSPRQLGFYHRALHEYLAAEHLASLPIDEQLSHVHNRAADVVWREVILALLSMTRASTLVSAIVAEIQGIAASSSLPSSFHLRELLTEIAVGPFACPPALSRKLAQEAITAVSTSWWMPHRERVLHILLRGLQTRRLRSLLVPQIRQWFPERVAYRESLLAEIAEWPEQDVVYSILTQNLLYEDTRSVQIAAARLIAEKAPDAWFEGHLLELARLPVPPRTRAAIALALLEGWGATESVRAVLNVPGNSLTPEIRYLQLRVAMLDGMHDQDTIDELLGLFQWGSGIEYPWEDLVKETILQELSGNGYARDACIAAVTPDPASYANERVWDILLEGFPQDPHVVKAVMRELRKERPLFRSVNWSVLSENFRDNPNLVAALDKWMATAGEAFAPQISGAALVGRTETAKRVLLEMLNSRLMFWPARALLDGWGMSDGEVGARLAEIADGPNPQAALIGHLLPRIIEDPEKCYIRLLTLLNDPTITRTDLIAAGLETLNRITDNREVVEIVTARAAAGTRELWALIGRTILGAPNQPGIRELALGQLYIPDGQHVATVHTFGDDPAARQRILEFLSPLPAGLRLLIAEHMRDLRSSDPEFAEICRDYSWDSDAEVSTAGAIAYARRTKHSESAVSTHIAEISKLLDNTDPLNHRGRQAASAALIEYGRLDLLFDIPDSSGKPRTIPLSDFLSINRPLIRLILDQWDSLVDRSGGDLLARLGEEGASVSDIWEWLAPYVDEHSSPSAMLLSDAEQLRPNHAGPNLLLFVARQKTRSFLLRDLCLGALERPLTNWRRDPYIWETAADILARQFSDDHSVWTYIADQAGRRMDSGHLVALARAQPENPILNNLAGQTPIEVLNELPAVVYYRLLCSAGTTEWVHDSVADQLSACVADDAYHLQWLYRPLMERLRSDPLLASSLFNLRASASPSPVTVALTSVFGGIPGLLPYDQVRKELEHTFTPVHRPPNGAVHGFDLQTGEVVPLSHLLLQILERAIR